MAAFVRTKFESALETKDEKKAEPVAAVAAAGAVLAGFIPGTGKPVSGSSRRLPGGFSLPPMLEATPRVSHTFRYAASNTATVSVSLAHLIGTCGGTCVVANSKLQPWASSVRIKSLTIWPPVASGNYTFVNWAASASGGYVPDTATMVNVPDSVTVTGALRFVPPKNSLASFWLNPVTISTSATVFGMTIKIGSILDFDVEFTLSNVSESGQQTIVAGILSNVYYLALDGPTSNKLVPQGVPTTA